MRLAISGSACQGKSTLVNDMLKTWPDYKRSDESYRKVLREEKLKINKQVDKDGQWKILNCLVDDILKTSKKDNIIFDRCPIDNLVYSLWSEDKQTSDIDKTFIDKCIPLIKESMRSMDIIFFLPVTKAAPVEIKIREDREIDVAFIHEIDHIFKAITYNHMIHGECPFMEKDDRPPIIEIFGNPEQRIEMLKLYLTERGDLIDDQSSVLSPENIGQMEAVLTAQKKALFEEKQETRVRNKIISGL
jgi:hypothetical protein